ncbi:MAG: phosphopantetheine-binding protein [Nitrospiraceae bacterium]
MTTGTSGTRSGRSEQRVLQALGEYLKREPSTIARDASLRDDLGLDSMATIELLYRVEEAFDLQIPDQDLPGMRTVSDVIAYVDNRLAPASPGASKAASPAQKPSPKKAAQTAAQPVAQKPTQGSGADAKKTVAGAAPSKKTKAVPIPAARQKPSAKKPTPTRRSRG